MKPATKPVTEATADIHESGTTSQTKVIMDEILRIFIESESRPVTITPITRKR